MPTLLDQHDGPGWSACISSGGYGRPSKIRRCGLNVGHDEIRRKQAAERVHSGQMIVDSPGLVGREPRIDDVALTMLPLFMAGMFWSLNCSKTPTT